MAYLISNIHDFDDNQISCPSIPLQKLFLFQADHMILKCPLNNFFWMTPYVPLDIGCLRSVSAPFNSLTCQNKNHLNKL